MIVTEFTAINGTVGKKKKPTKKPQSWKFSFPCHRVTELHIILGDYLLRSKNNQNFKNTLIFPMQNQDEWKEPGSKPRTLKVGRKQQHKYFSMAHHVLTLTRRTFSPNETRPPQSQFLPLALLWFRRNVSVFALWWARQTRFFTSPFIITYKRNLSRALKWKTISKLQIKSVFFSLFFEVRKPGLPLRIPGITFPSPGTSHKIEFSQGEANCTLWLITKLPPPAPKLWGKTRCSSSATSQSRSQGIFFTLYQNRGTLAGTCALLHRVLAWRKDRLEMTSRNSSCLVKEESQNTGVTSLKHRNRTLQTMVFKQKVVTLPLITVRTDRIRFVSCALIPGSSPNPPIPWSLPQPTVPHKNSQTG